MSKEASKTQFLRVLGRREVLALAFGAMIGWSWVVLSGTWISSAGTLGAIVAFLIGGAAILLIGLTYAELASALPFAGGEHVYSKRALGSGASFVCTWGIILGYVSVVTFEAVALPTVLDSLIPGLDRVFLWQIAGWDVYLSWVLVGVFGAVAMTVLNVVGVRMVALVQSVVVLAILLVGVLFVSGALFTGDISNMQPLFKDG
ncbi:MAG: APC family permease, partial [Gammaproteobacteria bacterium]|nr:APC family permease [Gammaproteobacteria bacterium]